MIFGLPQEQRKASLDAIAYLLKKGERLPLEKRYSKVAEGLDVWFKEMSPEHLAEFAGIGLEFYKRPFRVYVMFWPDRNNVLPFESGCEIRLQDEALSLV